MNQTIWGLPLPAAPSARRAIGKWLAAALGRDGGPKSSPAPTVMLSGDERAQTLTWRARAAAELQSIREDGLLGPNWRSHPRTAFLVGYLRGTQARVDVDNAARN